jgi:hypothetical protein
VGVNEKWTDGKVDLRELFHNPSFATRRVMLTSVDRFLTTADFALALSNFELTFEDILGSGTGIIHPAGDGKVGFLDNLLDDSRSGSNLGNGRRDANGARRGLNDTAWSAD